MIEEGIFRPIFGTKTFFKSGIWNFISRVEDKMGLLKERDQTIVTLETEISEVQENKNFKKQSHKKKTHC